jgi:hypothetical protein
MHPSGIKFGLSQGLLELNGADVVVSGPFLENLSEMARHWIRRRKRVTFIWRDVVTSGLRRMPYSLNVPSRELVPFYTGLDRIVFESMMPIAEQVGMGSRNGRHFFAGKTLWDRFRKDIRRPHMRYEESMAWRLHFRETYAAIKGLCKENAPEHLRHAELLALCQINNWMTERENQAMADLLGLG